MKKFIVLITIIGLAAGIVYSACSTSPSAPAVLNGFTIRAGEQLSWRVRCIDPDYGLQESGEPNIMAGIGNPSWISFGPLIVPDVNQYVFAPKNLDCNGVEVDPAISVVVSKVVIISPPLNTPKGNYRIDFSVTDGQTTTYFQIPFVVAAPPNIIPAADAGQDIRL